MEYRATATIYGNSILTVLYIDGVADKSVGGGGVAEHGMSQSFGRRLISVAARRHYGVTMTSL